MPIFKHKHFGKVRGVLINREPYFFAEDVGRALGLEDNYGFEVSREFYEKANSILQQRKETIT